MTSPPARVRAQPEEDDKDRRQGQYKTEENCTVFPGGGCLRQRPSEAKTGSAFPLGSSWIPAWGKLCLLLTQHQKPLTPFDSSPHVCLNPLTPPHHHCTHC